MTAETAASIAHAPVAVPTSSPPPNGLGRNGAQSPELYDLLRAMEAMRAGDFSVRLTSRDHQGELGRISVLFNEIVGANQNMAQQLERIGKAVGEVLRLKETINTMVDQLNGFAGEVTRVAREVGTEGKLGGQAQVPGVAGVWKDLTDNVNLLAANLTTQVRNIAEVTTAVAGGDLSKKITVDASGEILRLKETINTMVDQLNSFAGEVTRVAREVGTEGKLGGQAQVPGVAGTWKDLTDNVNSMATNLTGQVRNIAEVTTAVAGGDLSKKITVDVRGEILQLKETINTMVDQLNGFAGEVTRVAREVGTEGKLGGQAQVPGVAGTWKDLTDNVNMLAANLTTQVRNIAEVTTAVAGGDLSKKITVNVSGEVLQLKETINTMVDQLNGFAGEVTRVAREVGTEGKLGGQAQVPGVAGTWKDLTGNVNMLAANLIRPRKKRLLIAEDNEAEQFSITELLAHPDLELDVAGTGREALDKLRARHFDCMVLDLRLPDMTGFEVLQEIQRDEVLSDLPVVVFTGRELSAEEDAQLHTMARSIVVKGAASPERLFDETALFLHQVAADLPAEKKRMLERLHASDEVLAGRTVLVVDDDTRNIFALSSALERRGMRVLTSTTGREAISLLESSPEIAIVLMDIMMPEMDGYETIAQIRTKGPFRRLPIIALTAKAMKGDREKCLEAGASDYLAKPVNTEQLFSALRLWLHR